MNFPKKIRSLGVCTGVARGMVITGASNATPIVATVTGNRFQAYERVGVFGVATNTAANGIWTYARINATTGNLVGSAGNGAATMTNAVIAAIMDVTPFMRGHSAVAHAHMTANQLPFDGTFAVMGSRLGATDAQILASNSTTLATYFEDIATADGRAFSVGGPTNDGIDEYREVKLRKWMYLNCSAHTAGGVEVDIII